MRIHQTLGSALVTIQSTINWPRASQKNSLKAFIPDIGWALAVLLFFLVILRDAVRDLLKKSIDAIISGIMQRFAGSRVLRARSLRLYRNTIASSLLPIYRFHSNCRSKSP